jgi:NAD(P)H-nitrite reductase large subunit
MDPQQEEGRALRAEAEAAGVRCLDGAEAWSPAGEAAVLASLDGRTAVYNGRVLLVASGAYERAHAVPGWTLPGVLTTGALQTLIRSYGVLPGKRILIAGNGPLNLQVAVEAAAAGAEVIAAIEAAPMISPGRALQGVRLFAADPGLALKGLRLIQAARKAGIALRFGEVVRAVTCGDGGLDVEAGPLAGGSGRSLQADIVALGYGFLPSNELLRMIGCGQRWDSAFGQLRTVRDDSCETDVKGVFAVGDCAGLGGAPAALCEGVIAAAAIAQRLTGTVPAALEASAAQARADLARHRRFQNALWALYAAPRSGLSLAAPDTLVCRCEEVPKAQIQAAIADGAMTIGDLKRRTRCGMGRCQGRYCGVLVAEELARVTGSPVSETDFFAPRGPVKPVTIADIVGGFR